MKRIIVFLMALACTTAFSQNLKFFYNGTEIQDTVLLEVAQFNTPTNFTINILNNTDHEISIDVKKEKLIKLSGAVNTFGEVCCYEPDVIEFPRPLVLGAHEQSDVNDFHVTYNTGHESSFSLVKYSFIVEEQTFSIVLKFSSEASAIHNNKLNINKFNAYPNPCGKQVQIQYDFGDINILPHAKVVLTNLVGKEVRTISLSNSNGKTVIDLSDLPAGIYFYSLKVNEQIVSSKKLIIK